MGLRAVSGYFPGISRILSRQYASYIPLHPISGQYLDSMPVLCRQYIAYLPFTGILPVISRTPSLEEYPLFKGFLGQTFVGFLSTLPRGWESHFKIQNGKSEHPLGGRQKRKD